MLRILSRSRILSAGLIVLWILAAWPPFPAQAHANLVSSDPPQGAVLQYPPRVLTLEFSENLDPAFSKVELVDSNSQVVSQGTGVINPASPRVMRLALPGSLPNGTYSAVWQARSAADGHFTNGSVSFSIGNARAAGSLLPAPGAPTPATTIPSPVDTLLRWINYLFAALAVGSLLFGLLAWRPAYKTWPEREGAADERAGKTLRRLARIGLVGLLLASLAYLLYQAWQSTQNVFHTSFLLSLSKLLDPRAGELFWIRLLLLAMLFVLAGRLPQPGSGTIRLWGEAAAVGCAVLLTFSLQSHAAALSPFPAAAAAVTLDWMHLCAVAAWFGGLLPLFLLLRYSGMPPAWLVPKFSRVALVSVALLALSGLYSFLQQVGGLEPLVATRYGQALIIKVGLVLLLLLLGAVNLLVLSPRLAKDPRKAGHWLRNSVRLEIGLGLLVLLATGLLTGASPAKEALQAQHRLGYVGSYQEGGVWCDLWVAPGRAGDNEMAVDVDGWPKGSQRAAGAQGQVLLRLAMNSPNMDMGETQVEAVHQQGNRYEARGSYLSMSGTWQIMVILRQTGYDDIVHTFDVQVQGAPLGATPTNPVPADDASIAAGQALYQQNCLSCHGADGKGDGPLAITMIPHPADLTVHTAPGLQTDGQLFDWITNGYPGSQMPAFRKALTDPDRWNLVNYIRTLAR